MDATDSDSNEEDDELFSFQPFPPRKRKLPSKIVTPKDPQLDRVHRTSEEETKPCHESSLSVEEIAREKISSLSIPAQITSPTQLFFWVSNKSSYVNGKKKTWTLYHPCRICDPEEGNFLNINQNYDRDKMCLVQYFDAKSLVFVDINVVKKNSLIPYHGGEDVNNHHDTKESSEEHSWCIPFMQGYLDKLRQGWKKNKNHKYVNAREMDTQILSVQLYLNRILEKAHERLQDHERNTKKKLKNTSKSNQIVEPSQEMNAFVNSAISTPSSDACYSDDEEVEVLLSQSLPKKKVQLRAGDVVSYYAPNGVWGNKRFARQTKIVGIRNRSEDYPLELENGDLLEKTVKLLLVQKFYRGEMKDVNEGSWVKMQDYSLKSGYLEGYENSSSLSREVQRQRTIIKRNVEATKEKLKKEGFGDCSAIFQVK